MLSTVIFSLLRSYSSSRIYRLDAGSAHAVLSANAFMGRSGKFTGRQRQEVFRRLIGAGAESDPRSFITEYVPKGGDRLWKSCENLADGLLQSGVEVFGWRASEDAPSGAESAVSRVGCEAGTISESCPCVLFGKGNPDCDQPLLAVFNSRKPRFVSPDSDWLRALRHFFANFDPRMAVAASTGTLTHDLVSAYVMRAGLRRVFLSPSSLTAAERGLSKVHGGDAAVMPVLSCMLDGFCSKTLVPVCRDRIMGRLSDLHLILKIRPRGNLSAILCDIQARSPRPQLVFEPGKNDPSGRGNYDLLEKFPRYARGFTLPATGPVASKSAGGKEKRPGGSDAVARGDYLFHYTRGCPGPWPGETYRQYLLNLFDEEPLSGHSALETLIRILQCGMVLGGSRMVRGQTAVSCWSSLPPREVSRLRKWNRALVRWTVEPYGIAVRRDVLRSLGAKPAVYGDEQVYAKLAEAERHRFQLSRGDRLSSWRHECEWRLPGDLAFDRIRPDEMFAFVRTADERERVLGCVGNGIAILVSGD